MNFLTFSPRAQRVVVEEGHRAGMTVQAHVTSVESLDMAIDAGRISAVIKEGKVIDTAALPSAPVIGKIRP